jgi:glycosidase
LRCAKAATALALAGALILAVPTVATEASAGSASLGAAAAPEHRSAISRERIYFVMTDRYRNGDPRNDSGGRSGSVTVTGFLPESISYFHGGDLAGLTGDCSVANPDDQGLARLARMGFTAIWITPPFVQRTTQGDSAAYHGYWFLDLTRPDPHLGTKEEFAAFTKCAHSLGMKVIVDVVVNHTADVIRFPQGGGYVTLQERPYRTAAGKAFNPWTFTKGTRFPRLSATRSFAKTPQAEAGFEKVPAVLNDVTKYHNRGDINWSSCDDRCFLDGDFSGLDDLMTEDYAVVRALADSYGSWITDYGIDGFRIDTAKHTDPYFFGRWLPMINSMATSAGKSEFSSFGEVYEFDSARLSEIMLDRRLPSVLDFPFQASVRQFVTLKGTGATLASLFDADDYYTSATTNAYGLPTFLGNHDMGRIGFFLRTDAQSEAANLLDRDLLAHDLLYLTRGVPVVYYGDEVGMTGSGDGTDKQARQDMFTTQVSEWKSQPRIGTAPVGSGTLLGESTAISRRITQLSRLRTEHRALADGSQITRYGQDGAFVASRIDRTTRTEYVVAFNTGNSAALVAFPTASPSTRFVPLLGETAGESAADGRMSLLIPPRGTVVLKAERSLAEPSTPTVSVKAAMDPVTGSYRVLATVPGADPATVSFAYRRKGSSRWIAAGTDDARPFRVFLSPSRLGKNARIEVAAQVTSTMGQQSTSAPVSLTLKPLG